MPGDIDTLLRNGYWAPSQPESPEPRSVSTSTSNLPYSFSNKVVPRTSAGFNYAARKRRSFPPPPAVEDEADSVAREHHGVVSRYPEELPQGGGEVDQNPLIQEVHEFNPERRFVLVSNPSDSSSSSDDSAGVRRRPSKRERRRTDDPSGRAPGTRRQPSSYEAETAGKYNDHSTEDEDEARRRERDDKERRERRERRRSRYEDLPAIITDTKGEPSQDGRSKDIRRARSARGTEQTNNDDYFSPRNGSRTQAPDSAVTPEVIKHSTKGRDRAYYDYSGATPNGGQGRNRPSQPEESEGSRNPQGPRRNDGSARPTSSSPAMPKRTPATEVPRHVRRTSKEDLDTSRRYPEAPPAKLDRKVSSTSYIRGDREPRPRADDARNRRGSPRREDDRHSSDDEPKRRASSRRRRKSIINEDREGLQVRSSESKSTGGRRSKAPSPLPSPRVSMSNVHERDSSPSPRSPRSATFPPTPSKDQRRSEPANGQKEDDQPDRPGSRASNARPSAKVVASSSVPLVAAATTAAAVAAVAAAASADTAFSAERRKPNGPVPQPVSIPVKTRPTVESQPNSRSSSSNVASSPPKPAWQPPKLALGGSSGAASLEAPATSYRRYSRDAAQSGLPDLPDCPRTRPEAGHMDWLTLPRTDNFNICPSCYQSAFANSEFRQFIVPAPFRPRERAIKCDFGSQQWYHIAWLLTHKYKQPDLRLFQGVANVAASSQACVGLREVNRIWYTIKDPVSQSPVQNFNVCHTCAKTIEVLLPSLYGVFVPMDSPAEPSRGVCDMTSASHGYGDVRKRFISYFDDMESTADEALASRGSPDIRALADKVRETSLVDECKQGRAVSQGKWYMMRSIADMRVCEECFLEAVWPELERDEHGVVQCDFYQKPSRLPVAACSLYSHRMREVFQKAVKRNDLRYLEDKIQQREERRKDVQAQLQHVRENREALGAQVHDAQVRRLFAEWAKFE